MITTISPGNWFITDQLTINLQEVIYMSKESHMNLHWISIFFKESRKVDCNFDTEQARDDAFTKIQEKLTGTYYFKVKGAKPGEIIPT